MELSFRVHSSGWGKAAFIFAIGFLLVLPAGYGIWHEMGGGGRRASARQLVEMTNGNPTRDAASALARGDHRVLVVRHEFDMLVPGVGHVNGDLRKRYGFRAVPQVRAHDLTGPEKLLNRKGRTYAEAYNQYVVAHVPKTP